MPWLLHVDLDMFLAAVEIRRRPELRGVPLVIGGTGDPTTPRTVVTCASYPAREFGVRAGMPLRTALRRCPRGVFLPSDPEECARASAEVVDSLREFGRPVEVLGQDEAFLDAGPGPAAAASDLAVQVRAAVLERTRLDCSVGVGDSRQRAKLATSFAKPGRGTDRVFRLDDDNWAELLHHRPTGALWGVGPRTEANLAELGVHTVAQLADADPDLLVARFKSQGLWLRDAARGGGGDTLYTGEREPRSRGHQVTFAGDLDDDTAITRELTTLARAVLTEVVADGYAVSRVFVTLRTSTFWTRTRSRTLPGATVDPETVVAAALLVLGRFERRHAVRLLGVRLELAPRREPPG